MTRIYIPREGDRVTIAPGALLDYRIPTAVRYSGGTVKHSTGIIARVRLRAPFYATPDENCEDRFGRTLEDVELGWQFDAEALWPVDWSQPTEAEASMIRVFWGLVHALGLESLPTEPGADLGPADLVATVSAELAALREISPFTENPTPHLIYAVRDHISSGNGAGGPAI